jgi:Flp pilus assembly protein TadD
VYAVALNDSGQPGAAIDVLEASVNTHPFDRDSLSALATFLEQQDDFPKALSYAQRLNALDPGNPQVRELIRELSMHGNG